jgi:type I restriction enzyme S subunit
MRKGWIETTLGEVATFEYGKPLKAENRDGIGFPVFGSAGEVGRHSEPLIDDAPVIVVGRKGTAGAVWWSELPCSVIDTAYYVVPKMSVNFNFLFLLLGFIDLPSLTAQTGVPGLNRDRAYSSEVNLPPLAEQKRIVDVVSSVDAYIDALQELADMARIGRNAVLHELLSAGDDWTETAIGSECVVKGGKRLPKGTPWSDSPTAHPYIRATDFRNGRIDTSNLVYVPEEVWPVVSRYIVQADDVLITIAGTIGAIALVPSSHVGANLTENAALIRPVSASLDSEFLYLWLLGDDAQRQIADLTIGTTQKKLGLFRIESIQLRLPPLDEQKRIVEIVSSMDEVIQSTEQAVIDAKNLRSGLLSDLLSGEHEIPESYDVFVGAA